MTSDKIDPRLTECSVTIEMPQETFDRLVKASRRRDQSVYEFVKQAALDELNALANQPESRPYRIDGFLTEAEYCRVCEAASNIQESYWQFGRTAVLGRVADLEQEIRQKLRSTTTIQGTTAAAAECAHIWLIGSVPGYLVRVCPSCQTSEFYSRAPTKIDTSPNR